MSPVEKAKILIVDDDRIWREAMALLLKPHGITPDLVKSAEEAVAYLKTTTPNVIVTDTNMPGTSGLQLLRYIRETNRTVPVIVFFSGLAGSEVTVDDVMAMGATAVLNKGEAAVQLLRLISHSLINDEKE